MRLLTQSSQQHLDDVRARLPQTLLCLDFDGVLAPIVDDPAAARIHPRAHQELTRLGDRVLHIAIVTGRPVGQVLDLGSLQELGAVLVDAGSDLTIVGQYGAERWSATSGFIDVAEPPDGLARFGALLPKTLAETHTQDAHVEHKGLAIAVHTRRMPQPDAALARLDEPISALARECGLSVEHGRLVLEVRGGGFDKGTAVRRLVKEIDPGGLVYVGDDLGDLPAVVAVEAARAAGVAGLFVCAASAEEPALLDVADIAVNGTDGVMDFLATLGGDIVTMP
jgi:trehalose 6-phosphate phosphatase